LSSRCQLCPTVGQSGVALLFVTPDKCYSQKCAAFACTVGCATRSGIDWVFRARGVVVWTGCRQRAVYATLKHGGLADWAITELVALLDFLSFSFQQLKRFSGTCSTDTVLGLHTQTVALLCCHGVPQGPGVDYSTGLYLEAILHAADSRPDMFLNFIRLSFFGLAHGTPVLSLFVCYKTRADTAMSLRQARQKS